MLKKFVKSYFSIKNVDSFKIITIFGKKFKFKRKIKLGISYNLFDGEELLEASILSVRAEAFHISVIYQKKSYYGALASENIESFLYKLKEKGLIDEIYEYKKECKNENKHIYEKEKRDIGLKIAKKNGCTHFLCMDVDEFYDTTQLKAAKNFICRKNIKNSAVSIINYFKSPEYEINSFNHWGYYCPFIMKIYKFKKQKHNNGYYPCLVDPTRALNNKDKFYLFPAQEIAMHHMSSVRNDLDKKYHNTSLNMDKEWSKKLKNYAERILSWDFEKNRISDSDFAFCGDRIVKKVPNKFNIKLKNIEP